MSLNWQTGIWESNKDSPIGEFSSIIGGESPDFSAIPAIRSGPSILKYTIPADKKVTVKSITVAGHEPWTGIVAPPYDSGTFYLRVDAVDKAEWRSLDTGYMTLTGTRRYENTRVHGGFFQAGWSDGLQFTSGQVISVRMIPSNASMPKLVHAWMQGFETTGGAPVLQKTRTLVYGDTTDVLTYTVGTNGFTLLNFGAEAYNKDYGFCAFVNVLINGSDVMEIPFSYNSDSMSRPPNITIPFHDGVTMYPGDTIEFRITDIWQMGGRYTAMLHSMIESIGCEPTSGVIQMSDSTKPILGSKVAWGHPQANGLIWGLLFTEGAGKLANDITGRGSNGALVGCTWRGGKYGTALSLNGSSDYVRVPNHPKFNVSNFSLVIAVKRGLSDFTITPYFFGKYNSPVDQRSYTFYWDQADEKIVFVVSPDGTAISSLKTLAAYTSITEWYHIVATFNAQTKAMKIYINGKLENTGTATSGTIHASTADVTIGTYHPATALFFNGMIDSALIYNRDLSAEYIAWLYQEPYGMMRGN